MIDVENLIYAYKKSGTPAVKDISFRIDRGEIYGFLGPSGAGKSTTQKILYKLLSGYRGKININGKDLSRCGLEYYERIGVSFEIPNHFSKLSALDNLNFFSSLYSIKTGDPEELLDMVGLWEQKDVRVDQYSKGMKMRLNFVRALLHNPEILFLDEPTSGMDPVNGRKIKDIILKQKNEGKTIFITTHNMHDAEELCDRVAFIIDGRIELIDTPRNLKLKYGNRSLRVEYQEKNVLKTKFFELDSIGFNQDFIKILQQRHIETIHTQETTLEEVFIKVTGRNLT